MRNNNTNQKPEKNQAHFPRIPKAEDMAATAASNPLTRRSFFGRLSASTAVAVATGVGLPSLLESDEAKAAATKKVSTTFMTAFKAEFLSKANPWPAPAQPTASVIADFGMFMDVLLKADLLLQAPVPDNSGSLLDRLAKFLIAQKWPASSPIPKKWKGIAPTVRLIEVSVIADHLLEAINDWPGSGGGGTLWPPH
jgi:hypothetical protein